MEAWSRRAAPMGGWLLLAVIAARCLHSSRVADASGCCLVASRTTLKCGSLASHAAGAAYIHGREMTVHAPGCRAVVADGVNTSWLPPT